MKGLLVALILLAGCVREVGVAPAEDTADEVAVGPTVEMIDSPSAAGSAEPFLSRSARDGAILMSWIEPSGDLATVRYSRLDPASRKWSAPSTVASGTDHFVNWADFPSVVQTSDGTLFAHYLQKSGKGKYAYDVRIVRSSDDGAAWSKSVVLHGDGVEAEHGFVSIAPVAADAVQLVWLDGRKMTGGHAEDGEMSIRSRSIRSDGTMLPESELDGRTCECCQTGMTVSSDGPIVVYRDRSDANIRDISFTRLTAGSWTKPTSLHDDQWKIDGCPVNGPQIDALEGNLVAAWFTGGEGKSSVKVKFSDNGGAKWSEPFKVDSGAPMGRVDVVMMKGGQALVVWIEQNGERAEVRGRLVDRSGSMGEPFEVGPTTSSRSSGFPRIARADDGVYAAWTQTGDTPVIRVAKINTGGV